MKTKNPVTASTRRINLFVLWAIFAFVLIAFGVGSVTFIEIENRATPQKKEIITNYMDNKDIKNEYAFSFTEDEYTTLAEEELSTLGLFFNDVGRTLYNYENKIGQITNFIVTVITLLVTYNLFLLNSKKYGLFYNKIPVDRKTYYKNFILGSYSIVFISYLLCILLSYFISNGIRKDFLDYYENIQVFSQLLTGLNIAFIKTLFLVSIIIFFQIIIPNIYVSLFCSGLFIYTPILIVTALENMINPSINNDFGFDPLSTAIRSYKEIVFHQNSSVFFRNYEGYGIYWGVVIALLISSIIISVCGYKLFLKAKFLSQKYANFPAVLKIGRFLTPVYISLLCVNFYHSYNNINGFDISFLNIIFVLIISYAVSLIFFKIRTKKSKEVVS